MTSHSDHKCFEQELSPSDLVSTVMVASQEASRLDKTEADLERTLALLRAKVASTDIGILAMDSDAKAFYFNHQFAEMWQLPDSVELSRDCDRARAFFENQVKNPEVFRNAIWEASTQLETDSFDVLELQDGRLFMHSASPQRLGKKVIGRVWNVWDITKFKHSQKALPLDKAEGQTIREPEQVNDPNTTICHQFRSLLNIISFSNSLLDRNLNHWTAAQTQPYLMQIQAAVDQIVQLLDKISLLSESAARKLESNTKSLDIVGFCRDLIAEKQAVIDDSQKVIEFECQSNGLLEDRLMLNFDPELFYIVLENILDNAIKYSPIGSTIYFNLARHNQLVSLQIQDFGIGMSEVDQEHLFEPFFRGSNIEKVPGLGLGLVIARNLVDMHSGEIDWVSQIGVGTVVTIRLAIN
jgi:signal transduction histidine kinase